MKTSQDLQKISAGVSLFILALGFSSIGLMSLIHQPLSGDPLVSSALSCAIGGWASISVASIFLFAAFVYTTGGKVSEELSSRLNGKQKFETSCKSRIESTPAVRPEAC